MQEIEKRLKLDLQLFADGGETGGETEPESTPTAPPDDAAAFEEMYHNGPQQGEDGDGTGADGGGEGTQTQAGNGGGGNPEGGGQAQQQTQAFKNAHNAEMARQRRQREEAQRVQQARDELIRETYAGQIDPYTNRPILTEADLRQYQQRYQAEQMQQAGIDLAMIQNMVNNHPAVRQSQELLRQQQQARGQQLLNDDIKAISQYDPEIKTFQDVVQSEHFQEIDQMVRRGYSLADAYKLANMDRISQRKQAAAKQQVINQAAGKQHLQSTGQNGSGNEVVVPSDILAMYHEMMPNATDAEIKKHYARTRKG